MPRLLAAFARFQPVISSASRIRFFSASRCSSTLRGAFASARGASLTGTVVVGELACTTSAGPAAVDAASAGLQVAGKLINKCGTQQQVQVLPANTVVCDRHGTLTHAELQACHQIVG